MASKWAASDLVAIDMEALRKLPAGEHVWTSVDAELSACLRCGCFKLEDHDFAMYAEGPNAPFRNEPIVCTGTAEPPTPEEKT